MIRNMKPADIPAVMEIWLNTNIKAHDFIAPDYWRKNYDLTKTMMSDADIYVYERERRICGFVGLMKDYIAGIFVDEAYQGSGIGKSLLDYVKQQKDELVLHVYEKNKGAVRFYLREGFVKEEAGVEEENQETEYKMRWEKDELREKSGI